MFLIGVPVLLFGGEFYGSIFVCSLMSSILWLIPLMCFVLSVCG